MGLGGLLSEDRHNAFICLIDLALLNEGRENAPPGVVGVQEEVSFAENVCHLGAVELFPGAEKVRLE